MENIRVRLARVWAVCITFISLIVLAGCGTQTSTSSLKVVNIEVDAVKAQLALGTTQQYSATALFSDGSKLDVTDQAAWSSTQPGFATVSNASPTKGFANTAAVGTTFIVAAIGSVNASKQLIVTPAAVTAIGITPAAPSVPKGMSKQLTATGTFTDGTTQDITSSVLWSSSDATTVAVSNASGTAGQAQALKQGAVTVSAVLSGVTGSTTVTGTAAVLSRVDIAPTNPTVPNGLSKQFSATGVFSDGTTQDLTTSSTWSSSNTSIATVVGTGSSAGLAQTLAQGATTISATNTGISGTTTLTVTAGVLASINVTPPNPSVPNGLSKQFTATGSYTDGSTQDITASVVWHSSSTSVATVSNAAASAGLAKALAQGTSTISAQSGDISGSTTLTVAAAVLSTINVTPINPSVPNGLNKQFTATGTYTDGTTQNITSAVTWSSSNTAAATISNAPVSIGLAHAQALGVATITAQSGAITGSATITVTAAELASIGVTPPTSTIAKGLTQQFTATGTFTDGSTQNLTSSVTWNSSSSSVASISNASASAGLAQSAAKGVTTISAAQSGITGTTTLTVSDATLARVDVTPENPSVPKGLTKQFTATGVFTDGTTTDLTTVATWTSSNTGVALISNAAGSNGLAAANTQGNATISAATQGLTGSTTLTVTAASLISIQVTPTSPSLPVGFTRPLTATGRYSDSTTQDITQQVTWGSTNTAVVTVDNSTGNQGVATGGAAGSATVTAQQGSIIGQTSLTVTSATLTSIQVAPATANIALGNKQPFSATGNFSDSTTLDITKQVSWSSGNTGVATISNAADSAGLASSVSQGTAVISALRAGTGITGTANLTVSSKALVSIGVSPAASSVPKGRSVAYVATGTFTDGTSDDITSAVSWSSSNTSVVTISNAAGTNGKATAVATGQVTVTAQQGSVSGSTTLTVTAAVLSSISVTPSAISLPQGLKQPYAATGIYSDNSQQDLTQVVTWSSSNAAVATISNANGSRGLASTLTVGVTSITAALDGVGSDPTSLTVTPVALTSITLSPSNASVPNGEFRQYSATGNYSDGSSVDLTQQVTWSSSNTSIADVSNAVGTQGKVITKAVGGVTIRATEPVSAVFGTTSLNVTAARLVGITVTAASGATQVPAGYSKQYVAVGQYSDGTTQDITAVSSWTSFNPAIAAVGNATANKGLVQGIAVGSTSISVSLSGVSGTGSIVVTNATLSSLTLSPTNATIHPNGTLQYSAVGTFSDSSTLTLTQQVTWASSNSSAATISNAAGSKGLATAGGAILGGTTSISAAANGVSKSTQLTRAVN